MPPLSHTASFIVHASKTPKKLLGRESNPHHPRIFGNLPGIAPLEVLEKELPYRCEVSHFETTMSSEVCYPLHHQASEWINRQELLLLPLRVCSNWLRAMPVQHVRAPEQAQECTSPKKNCCDKQVSSWRHISCHTDKNRYYT